MLFYSRLMFVLLVIVSLSLANCQCQGNEADQFFINKNDDLTLLITSEVQGYVEPCGCNSNPLGGVGRLSFLVKQAQHKKEGKVVFLDAGNLLFHTSKQVLDIDKCQDDARLKLLLSTYKSLGLAFTVKGNLDKARGEDFYKTLLQTHGIQQLTDFSKAEDGYVAEKGGVRLGFFLVKSPLVFDASSKQRLQQVVIDFKKKQRLDIVAAIFQSNSSNAKKLFYNNTLLDLVVLGSADSEKPLPAEKLGPNGPVLVSVGKQGQYLGVVNFYRSKEKGSAGFKLDDKRDLQERRENLLKTRVEAYKEQLKSSSADQLDFLKDRLQKAEKSLSKIREEKKEPLTYERPTVSFRSIALTRKVPADDTAQKSLEKYEKQIPLLVEVCESRTECSVAVEPGEAHFVGAETCKNCHQQAYEFWEKAVVTQPGKDENGNKITRKLGHSIAWSTLQKANSDKDRNCIGCHSAGFMEPGGYCKVSQVKQLKNVQCENCHGPGSTHVETGDKSKIKRQVPESVCRNCHHVPHIENYESFKYEEKLQHILGKGHGFDLLNKIKHKQ